MMFLYVFMTKNDEMIWNDDKSTDKFCEYDGTKEKVDVFGGPPWPQKRSLVVLPTHPKHDNWAIGRMIWTSTVKT